MVSPMQRRRMRLDAERKAKSVGVQASNTTSDNNQKSGSSTNAWDLVRSTIDADIKQLKKIKPLAQKIEYKQKVIENYQPYLTRSDIPVDIKMLLMVWLFDIGKIGDAITICIDAIEKGYKMPDFIKSSSPEFLADTVFDWSEKQFKAGHSAAPYFDQVFKLVTEKFNTYEVITAKYYKLAGLMALGKHGAHPRHVSEPERLKTALAMFTKADQIYDRARVGTRIAEINKRLAILMIDHND